MGTALALDTIIIASTAAALFLSRRPRANDEAGGPLGPPVLSLAAVIAVIYINQVLFTVYVIRVRHGDPSFIARYLPPAPASAPRAPRPARPRPATAAGLAQLSFPVPPGTRPPAPGRPGPSQPPPTRRPPPPRPRGLTR